MEYSNESGRGTNYEVLLDRNHRRPLVAKTLTHDYRARTTAEQFGCPSSRNRKAINGQRQGLSGRAHFSSRFGWVAVQ